MKIKAKGFGSLSRSGVLLDVHFYSIKSNEFDFHLEINKPENKKRTQMIEYQARKLLPQLNEVKSTWLGFRPTLPDSLPVIGSSKINKNIIYGFGHQHIGWTLGAVTGKIINSICNERLPNINIEPFSPSRFN